MSRDKDTYADVIAGVPEVGVERPTDVVGFAGEDLRAGDLVQIDPLTGKIVRWPRRADL